jgi:glycerol kinase
MAFDIHRCAWDEQLLRALDLPRSLFASPVRSSGVVAETDATHFGRAIPIAGIAGDQQAALFGQACFDAGEAKNTYGTGCFLLVNTGAVPRPAEGGLLTTIAWDIGAGTRYALEGSVFISGAAVQWLRDGLGIIANADETEALATSVASSGGVYFVPAFTGLGAPYWDPYARGLMIGLERGTTRAHLVRATLESIAFQTRDLVATMRAAGTSVESLRADGGGTANAFLMQLQADVLGIPVDVAAVRETTALGAAFLAGLGVGVWKDTSQLRRRRAAAARYEPRMSADQRDTLYAEWQRAVERARGWAPQRPAGQPFGTRSG